MWVEVVCNKLKILLGCQMKRNIRLAIRIQGDQIVHVIRCFQEVAAIFSKRLESGIIEREIFLSKLQHLGIDFDPVDRQVGIGIQQ